MGVIRGNAMFWGIFILWSRTLLNRDCISKSRYGNKYHKGRDMGNKGLGERMKTLVLRRCPGVADV